MESALERSSFAAEHFGQLVAASPSWSNQEAINHVLDTMYQFTDLWCAPASAWDHSCFLSVRAPSSPLFRDRRERVKQDVETAQYHSKRWRERNNGEGLSPALLENLQHEVQGNANWVIDQGHPFAELLELPECKEALREAVQSVYRRLMRAPKLADSHTKACAIVWKGYDIGMSNLTRWQRTVVAINAHKVAEALDAHRAASGPSQAAFRSLGHRVIPALTARQARRSRVSQGELRLRWESEGGPGSYKQ